MKFARYLQETQTPEWKKAYIDYRGLKKRITAIRRAQEGLETASSSVEEDEETAGEDREPDIAVASSSEDTAYNAPQSPPQALAESPKQLHVEFEDPVGSNPQAHVGRYSKDLTRSASGSQSIRSIESNKAPSVRSFLNSQGEPSVLVRTELSRKPSLVRMITAPLFRRSSMARSVVDEPANDYPLPPISQQMPLHVMLPKLFCTPDRTANGTTFTTNYGTMDGVSSAVTTAEDDEPTYTIANAHKKFFAYLDAELEKVDHFYIDRELEMQARGKVLKEQLEELGDHRKIFHAAHAGDAVWHQKLAESLLDPVMGLFQNAKGKAKKASKKKGSRKKKRPASSRQSTSLGNPGPSSPPPISSYFEEVGKLIQGREASPSHAPRFEPDEYLHAKKKLQKAVLEHYRGLEALNNFRILNMTGFRKALKKYEKTTKIPAQMAYLKEKVDPSSFAHGESVSAMINETEELFTTRFAKGDKKTAIARLRIGGKQKSHHFSMFRSGIMLGLSIPPTVAGIYSSFQEDTREEIPGWDALIIIYATFMIPVLFSLLFGLNLLVWAQSRINYVFIFELDVRTRMDYREYFELPSLLVMSLAYSFWLSFTMIGPPTLWPLVWLCFAAAVMLQPFDLFFQSSRFWLLKKAGKLLVSGAHRVEFTDFFLGDQFCSLVFSLSNLYSVACTYHTGFDRLHVWKRCSAHSSHWGFIFLLATLPLLARFVQSIRRFVDSRLVTHLVNAGKYAAGIIYYFTYFYWRHQGKSRILKLSFDTDATTGSPRGASFVAYCLCAVFYSIYACSWDFLMDWSLLRPHARYPLLRPELAYSNHISLYYLTMIQNIILRFVWTIHIVMPHRGLSSSVRSFIAAMLEMVRRIIWNFYRLENEHMGNMDQYRITREVPLPYTIEDRVEEDEDDEVDRDGMPKKSPRDWLKKARENLSFRGKRSQGDDGGQRPTET